MVSGEWLQRRKRGRKAKGHSICLFCHGDHLSYQDCEARSASRNDSGRREENRASGGQVREPVVDGVPDTYYVSPIE